MSGKARTLLEWADRRAAEQNVGWLTRWMMDTPKTVMTTGAPAVLKTSCSIS